jgi:hypothetical protein
LSDCDLFSKIQLCSAESNIGAIERIDKIEGNLHILASGFKIIFTSQSILAIEENTLCIFCVFLVFLARKIKKNY